jgi:hypothetical protein
MKYIKLFEDNKNAKELEELEELYELIPIIRELCQDLEDNGFLITFTAMPVTIFDFSEYSMRSRFERTDNSKSTSCLILKIFYHNSTKSFNINMIKDNLYFIESYIKGELNLDLNYIYANDINVDKSEEFRFPYNFYVRSGYPSKYLSSAYHYFKDVETLPDDVIIDRDISMCFMNSNK